MEFCPFHDIDADHPCVVVDARHPEAAATLSHWRGAPVPDGLRADTSTEIVLNAIKVAHPSIRLPYVSNNHFDVDGCLGIWALMYPHLANRHNEVLKQAALIGDFREYDPAHPASDTALKLVCWMNTIEKKLFYEPFGQKNEAVSSIPKYEYFLPLIADFLAWPELGKTYWEKEYEQVTEDLALINQAGKREYIAPLHLTIVSSPRPVHYYALFSQTQNSDYVLSMYANQRYELEVKYVSWVDTITRNLFPRFPLAPLAEQLNVQEESGLTWTATSVMDTGPQVLLGSEGLTKAKRFDHPFERIIPSSSISPENMKKEVLEFLAQRTSRLEPKTHWTWLEMKSALEEAGIT